VFIHFHACEFNNSASSTTQASGDFLQKRLQSKAALPSRQLEMCLEQNMSIETNQQYKVTKYSNLPLGGPHGIAVVGEVLIAQVSASHALIIQT